ncbi:MAG: YdcH family protein [Sphingomonadales bacterium]|nr:YdcH family protein [Sphingomonadales bacterium]
MSQNVFRLMQYHQNLDHKLRAELARRWPDMLQVQRLKRLKLAVKDRLARLAVGPQPIKA